MGVGRGDSPPDVGDYGGRGGPPPDVGGYGGCGDSPPDVGDYGGRGDSPPDVTRKVVQSFQHPAPVGVSAEMAHLSLRKREIRGLLAQAYLYKEIASDLGISVPTVNAHIRNL